MPVSPNYKNESWSEEDLEQPVFTSVAHPDKKRSAIMATIVQYCKKITRLFKHGVLLAPTRTRSSRKYTIHFM